MHEGWKRKDKVRKRGRQRCRPRNPNLNNCAKRHKEEIDIGKIEHTGIRLHRSSFKGE